MILVKENQYQHINIHQPIQAQLARDQHDRVMNVCRLQAAEQLRSEGRSEESVSTALEAECLRHPAANMDLM